jgi:hypothetical protein
MITPQRYCKIYSKSNTDEFDSMKTLQENILPKIKEKNLNSTISQYLFDKVIIFDSPILNDCVNIRVENDNIILLKEITVPDDREYYIEYQLITFNIANDEATLFIDHPNKSGNYILNKRYDQHTVYIYADEPYLYVNKNNNKYSFRYTCYASDKSEKDNKKVEEQNKEDDDESDYKYEYKNNEKDKDKDDKVYYKSLTFTDTQNVLSKDSHAFSFLKLNGYEDSYIICDTIKVYLLNKKLNTLQPLFNFTDTRKHIKISQHKNIVFILCSESTSAIFIDLDDKYNNVVINLKTIFPTMIKEKENDRYTNPYVIMSYSHNTSNDRYVSFLLFIYSSTDDIRRSYICLVDILNKKIKTKEYSESLSSFWTLNTSEKLSNIDSVLAITEDGRLIQYFL